MKCFYDVICHIVKGLRVQFFISIEKTSVNEVLSFQSFFHFKGSDAEFLGATLYRHDGEMDLTICIV